MKIDSIQAQNVYQSYQNDGVKAADSRNAAASVDNEATKKDTLELSTQASSLRDARALSTKADAAGDGGEHARRLAAVKAAVADGTYHVEAREVTRSLLKGTVFDRRA